MPAAAFRLHSEPSAPINPDDVIIGDAVIGSDGGSGLQFSLVVANSGLGHRYQLKSTDDLIEPVWQNASGILSGNGGGASDHSSGGCDEHQSILQVGSLATIAASPADGTDCNKGF